MPANPTTASPELWSIQDRCRYCFNVSLVSAANIVLVGESYYWTCPACQRPVVWSTRASFARIPHYVRLYIARRPDPLPWYKRAWEAMKRPFLRRQA